MLIYENLPDPIQYYENLGHRFTSKGEWMTTDCPFHGGSDSFRVHRPSGSFKCMSCLQSGGGIISHYMQYHGVDFKQACIDLGAWKESGNYRPINRPSPISASKLLNLLCFELQIVWNELTRVKLNKNISPEDMERVRTATKRILWAMGEQR